MVKQISTYGAALLTLMVIVRASTMENNLDLTSLYQRATDQTFEITNNTLRADYLADYDTPNLLLAELRTLNEEKPSVRKNVVQTITVEENEIIASLIPDETIAVAQPLVLDDIENEGLSLDRESTVNSNLSLYLPRQRINPKPVQNLDQE